MIQAIDGPGSSEEVSSQDRILAVLSHISGWFTGFIVPLVIWLIHKNHAPFVAHHARESLNYQISLMVYSFGVVLLLLGLYFVFRLLMDGQSAMYLSLFLLSVLGIALLIFEVAAVILASVAASSGKLYRYPLCIRGV